MPRGKRTETVEETVKEEIVENSNELDDKSLSNIDDNSGNTEDLDKSSDEVNTNESETANEELEDKIDPEGLEDKVEPEAEDDNATQELVPEEEINSATEELKVKPTESAELNAETEGERDNKPSTDEVISSEVVTLGSRSILAKVAPNSDKLIKVTNFYVIKRQVGNYKEIEFNVPGFGKCTGYIN